MSLIRNTVFVVIALLFNIPGMCNEKETSLTSEGLGVCENCVCLAEIGDHIYSKSNTAEKSTVDFQSKHCHSQNLPSPGNLMASGVINRDRINSSAGGSLENCHDQWNSIVKSLTDGTYNKECSSDESTSALLTRCNEDQYMLAELGNLTAQQSSKVGQPSTGGSNSCNDVASVFSALNVLVRFENTAFLNHLIESGALKNLIQTADEDTKQALYILTQHSENFPQVQIAILNIRKSLLEDGIGEPQDIAALADRVQIMENGTQLYGTHIGCKSNKAIFLKPIDDIEIANQRRALIGLVTVQEFLDSASKNC